jgi:hypothetical protein
LGWPISESRVEPRSFLVWSKIATPSIRGIRWVSHCGQFSWVSSHYLHVFFCGPIPPRSHDMMNSCQLQALCFAVLFPLEVTVTANSCNSDKILQLLHTLILFAENGESNPFSYWLLAWHTLQARKWRRYVSPEVLVHFRTTLHYVSEDIILHSHCREYPKFSIHFVSMGLRRQLG